MRAGLYYRVSTSGQTHALQRDELRRLAEHRGFTTVEYTDTGSGSGLKLPERDRMLADARAGKLDIVVCWKFDRFGRSTRDLLDALDCFRRWNVEFISVSEGLDTSTPMGKLVFTMFAALGEFEKSLIAERVRAGLAAARRRGKTIGRPRRSFDLSRARKLIDTGTGLAATARAVGVSPRTLRRHLAGLAGRQNPGEIGDSQTAGITRHGDTTLEGGER
jgi:DNA invertase Pin-like site-specific DNA recombinase